MAKVITVTKSRQKYAVVGLGYRGAQVATVKAAVYDGDTVTARPYGNFGVRFLGVDAPEKALPDPKDPKDRGFYALWSEPKKRKPGEKRGKNDDGLLWTRFMADTALQQYDDSKPMDPELRDHLARQLKAAREGAAKNHRYHAEAADKALTNEIKNDVDFDVKRNKRLEDFRFFLAFAYDVMDGYGRLLCYINRDEPNEARRKEARANKTDQYYYYQERLMRAGMVSPYFMWPNVDPFIRRLKDQSSSIVAEVFTPDGLPALLARAPRLTEARQFVRDARTAGKGIFDRTNADASPLVLEAFELRFLARGSLPRRYVIDLSATKSTDDYYGVLIEPEKYFYVKNAEDRLYIPEEFVPLFLQEEAGKAKYGWQMRAKAARKAVAVPAAEAKV